MTVTFRGSNTDLHSGAHGGIVYNPNRALVEVLGKLFDPEGRVLVPGFYDGIEEVSAEDKKSIDFSFDTEHYKAMFAAETNGGEHAYSPLESAWMRPTLEINGIAGGYSGDGFKTVIPAIAKAKISCRLVPGQNSQAVYSAVESYISKLAPEGIEVTIEHEHSGNSMRTSPSSVAVQAAAQAYTEVCGIPCSYIMCGGSVPVTASVAAAAGAETVLIGYGLPGDNLHAPNEHFGVERVRLGFATIGRMLELFEKLPLRNA
jgi:acetylornithine deacetylase/succinyl-diaminopimelate desuccinylase-like protein